MADPSAMGRANSVARMVTEKDPTISGSAPKRPSEGIQFWPVRNEPRSTPSVTNVARPCCATMINEREDHERDDADTGAGDAQPDVLEPSLGHHAFCHSEPFS